MKTATRLLAILGLAVTTALLGATNLDSNVSNAQTTDQIIGSWFVTDGREEADPRGPRRITIGGSSIMNMKWI